MFVLSFSILFRLFVRVVRSCHPLITVHAMSRKGLKTLISWGFLRNPLNNHHYDNS